MFNIFGKQTNYGDIEFGFGFLPTVAPKTVDHIFKLVVVDLWFKRGNAYISLNSINKASTARTCLSSRTEYQISRIDHFADECSQFNQNLTLGHRSLANVSNRFNEGSRDDMTKPTNRFEILSAAKSQESQEDRKEDDIATIMELQPNRGVSSGHTDWW